MNKNIPYFRKYFHNYRISTTLIWYVTTFHLIINQLHHIGTNNIILEFLFLR